MFSTIVLTILLLDLRLCFMNFDCVLYGKNVLLMLTVITQLAYATEFTNIYRRLRTPASVL